ncbi:unnamed protein product [Ostreobium quekettii]|uniref:Cyanobacterial aminoacyl-tRNA synthetase CAAD domain-containing protein n=1 Tax=Ostreobium quekettii TaxID=121088 RepID=A0A8S1J9Z3_9CHLO|nr:unnamed protein product [Ostreobium quekettii]|eukprot:evm.model.scf_1215EXC.1 EVM.evm.TU.scf_1215EXC.1   scf_1215EXC:4927-6520(-)
MSTEGIQQRRTVIKAQKSSFDATEKIDEFTSYLEKQWDETEQKPVAVAVIIAGLVALYAVNGIVGNVEKIPVFGFLFEIVGILVTGWFGYRYLVFESDREELKQNIDDFLDKVKGN